MMYHNGHFWGMGGGWFIGEFIIVLFIIVLVAGVFRRTGPWNYRKDSALEILRERYARGEISKEEYEERKKILS